MLLKNGCLFYLFFIFFMIQRQTSDKPHETTASECNDEYA